MIEITLLDAVAKEQDDFLSHIKYLNNSTSLLDWGCGLHPVQKLTYNGHDLDYHGDLRCSFF